MLAFCDMELSPCPKYLGTGASRGRSQRFFYSGSRGADLGRTRHGERGSGNLKAVIWTAILVAFIYAAVIIIPVLINEYEFQDSLQNIARFASVNRKTNEQIKQAVLDEAQKEDIPVQADDIKVEGSGGNVHISVDYSVTVDLKVYQWTLNFHPAASNASIL
jgi:cell division protein FtsL